MPTFTALTTLPGKDRAEALGEALERLDPAPTGVGVLEVEDGSGLWEVGGYFIDAPDDIALTLLAAAWDCKPFVVSELPDVDWVAHVRRELSPVTAGRFFVYGSHDADKVPEGVEPLLVEASMAFGTGHHGTTLGCLQALERLISNGVAARHVIDVGCGTAVLAMAAVRVWDLPVMASDIDGVAIDVAAANLGANGLTGRVDLIEAAGFDHADIAKAAPFDLVFANILKGPLIELAPDMARHTAPGGHVILSGILNPQADEVIENYSQNGFNLVHHDKIVEWSSLTFRIKT